MLNPDRESNPEDAARRLLTAADYFLGKHDFAECRKFLTRAKDAQPTNLEADRISAILSVLSVPNLSSNSPDYYAILELPRFERSIDRIWSNFETLESFLNPTVNSRPLSGEAHDLVLKAWGVLSDPAKKERFDAELRRISGCPDTFWTMCPYCYYVYEFDRAFEDCCLKCSNEKCTRVLHAVEIAAPPPPAEVVEKGYYLCPGFVQCVSAHSNGENLWVPFDSNCARPERSVHGLKKAAMIGEMGVHDGFMENGSMQKGKKRKAHMHRQSKKLMGNGIRVDMNKANAVLGDFEGRHFYNDSNGIDSVSVFGGQRKNNSGGVEFYEGDDDVLVGVHSEMDVNLVNK